MESVIAYIRKSEVETIESELPELYDDERVLIVEMEDDDFEDMLETEMVETAGLFLDDDEEEEDQ
jgi:hypothetical protein